MDTILLLYERGVLLPVARSLVHEATRVKEITDKEIVCERAEPFPAFGKNARPKDSV